MAITDSLLSYLVYKVTGGGELWLKGRDFVPVGITLSRSLYSLSL